MQVPARSTLQRIRPLFRPYRRQLVAVIALIVVSAGLGMISPFLLRDVLDEAIPEKNTELLTLLVGGMIAIAVVTGVLNVGQTWLSNLVGQRVMHDLRTRVYAHLQRLSLAFFTRTRTGEVQSRIANDIGGVESVVTTTATSTSSNLTTVIATVVAMFLLDWRLAVFSLTLLPFFVLLTKRVGAQRKRIAAQRQQSMSEISSLVQESLSVSGILLGKTMGRAPDLAGRFRGESSNLADLEVRSRMAGRWVMGSIQATFAIMPALVYWFAGMGFGGATITIGTLVAFTTLQTRLFFPLGCCCRSRSTCRPRWRCSSASSSTSTCRSRSPSAPAPARWSARPSPARSPSTTSGSATPPTATGPSPAPRSRCRAAARPRSWARPARARPRSATCSRASTTPSAAG